MRASKAPEQWQQVLDAVNRDDYELANKLAVKYGFGSAVNKEKIVDNIRHTPLKGDYVAQSPDGKMYCHERANALSMHLGLSFSYVASAIKRLGRQGGYSQSGKVKGYLITQWGVEQQVSLVKTLIETSSV